MKQTIRFKLNDHSVSITTDGERPLLWVLRTELGLTGTKYGCGQGQCGACTVIIDKKAVRSCKYPLKNVAGKEVLTIEGLAAKGNLHPLEEAFIKHSAVQCGFCTPGMILKGYSMLEQKGVLTRAEIIAGMDSHLCRCGTYGRIIEAIESVVTEQEGRAK